MCKMLEISRSSFYRWKQANKSNRTIANEALLKEIESIHEQFYENYGVLRITDELKKRGKNTGHNRVARIKKLNGIYSKLRKKWKIHTTDSKHNYPIAPNLLAQNFTASEANKVWVSDFTYVWTKSGWLYLCTIIDLYSRKVVGWAMDDNLKTALLIKAMKMAINRRNPAKGLIFHSDRGVQYASNEFRKLLKNYGFIQSMSRKGDCYDNAVAESFFKTLKGEELDYQKFNNFYEAKSCIFRFIEIYYNRKRSHSYLGYLSPEQFELKNSSNVA
jgi:putative transposase